MISICPVHTTDAGWLMAAQHFVVMGAGTTWTVCSALEVARCLQTLSAAQFLVISDEPFLWVNAMWRGWMDGWKEGWMD